MAKTKSEIDKELMYKKLMPSGPKTVKSAQDSVNLAFNVPTTQVDLPQTVKEEPFNQHNTIVRREVGVPSMDTQPTILVNTMEDIVLEKLDSVLARFKCCKCDRCKKDIVAIALNKLQPKYMVVVEGQPIPDVGAQTNAEVVTAMIQAVIAVRAKPRH